MVAPAARTARPEYFAEQINQAGGALLRDPESGAWLSNLDPRRSAFGLRDDTAQYLIAAGLAARKGESLVLVKQGAA